MTNRNYIGHNSTSGTEYSDEFVDLCKRNKIGCIAFCEYIIEYSDIEIDFSDDGREIFSPESWESEAWQEAADNFKSEYE